MLLVAAILVGAALSRIGAAARSHAPTRVSSTPALNTDERQDSSMTIPAMPPEDDGGFLGENEKPVYPYEAIRFEPFDHEGNPLPEQSHTFSLTVLVDPWATLKGLALNPEAKKLRANMFKSDTEACSTYLHYYVDDQEAAHSIRHYNAGIDDVRIPRVRGFRAFCVRIDYLEECEQKFNEPLRESWNRILESGASSDEIRRKLMSSQIASMQAIGRQCYPMTPVTPQRCFTQEGECQ